MSAKDVTTCSIHGVQQATFVCQHIVAGLTERKRVGFFWTTSEPDNPRPDAYCSACEDRVRKTAGEWIDEALEHLQPEVLCGACYDLAKNFTWAEILGRERVRFSSNLESRSYPSYFR